MLIGVWFNNLSTNKWEKGISSGFIGKTNMVSSCTNHWFITLYKYTINIEYTIEHLTRNEYEN